MNKVFFPIKICLFLLMINSLSFANAAPVPDMYIQPTSDGRLYIQAGAFKSVNNAENYRKTLASRTRHPVIITPRGPYHLVWVGPMKSIQSANTLRMALMNLDNATQPTKTTQTQRPRVKQPYTDPLSYVATVSAGPAWLDKGSRQTFFLQPTIERSYVPSEVNTPAVIEVFTGIRHPIYPKLDAQFGITGVTSSNITYNGTIWDDALPQFNNFKYAYDIHHLHVGLKGKLLSNTGYPVAPYLSGSVALAFNEAKNFTNTPLIPEAVVQPNFQPNTTTTFAYTLGIGVQTNLYQHWHLGVGYEFADWGKAQLARSFEQTLGNGLSIAHLYINQLQFSVSYYT